MRIGPPLCGVAVATTIAACGGGADPARLDPPAFTTSHALFATAPAGRGVTPATVQVVRAADLGPLTPEPIGGTDVDMVVAGLDAADLPAALGPEALVFVDASADGARPLPALTDPHVLRAPSPPETPEPLVPVEADGVQRDVREARAARLASLIDDLAIEAPCASAELRVTAPRTSAEVLRVFRPLPDGSVAIGLSVTSTVMLGFLPAGGGEPRFEGVPTAQDLLEDGEVAEITWLSANTANVRGRIWPAALTVDITGGFSSSGVHLVWSPAAERYVSDTPFTVDTAPRALDGVARLTLDGAPSVCVHGAAQGSDRRATLWCRTETSTVWRASVSVPRAGSITALLPDEAGEAHLATDQAGTVYAYAGGDQWATAFETALNAGCDPLCAALGTVLPTPEAPFAAVMAGARAQVLLLERSGGGVGATRPAGLDPALFADERPASPDALRFTAAARAPDGALWLADLRPTLLRLSPDGAEVTRVCLPEEMRDVPIAAIATLPDGRLLLGMSPAFLGVGSWRL